MCVMLASMRRSLRAARVATFAYFAVNGFVMGTWVVHINVIACQAGVGTAMLGYLLLALGGSAFAGMRLCGPLNDRLGPRRVIPVSAALFSAAVVLPALAHNVWSLAGALAALGFSSGGLDVSMNTHAVKVEHRYRRPIMSAFHATWSLGGVVAAIAGARTISWGWPRRGRPPPPCGPPPPGGGRRGPRPARGGGPPAPSRGSPGACGRSQRS